MPGKRWLLPEKEAKEKQREHILLFLSTPGAYSVLGTVLETNIKETNPLPH